MSTVFISYNHNDKEIATKVRLALEAQGIRVTIDSESMTPGADIQAFIHNSIRETEVTLSIVSKNSLTSDWVAMETMVAFSAEMYLEGKKFIACHIDDEMFRPEFLPEAIDTLDQQIKRIEELIRICAGKNVNATNYETRKRRMYELRQNLPVILQRLQGSLVLDIREPKFEPHLNKIISVINDSNSNDDGKKGDSRKKAGRDKNHQSQAGSDDVIKYHHLCDRRPQITAFRKRAGDYLKLNTIESPLIFFVHGQKSGSFEHIFDRLDKALIEEVDKIESYETVEQFPWVSPPKPGNSTDEILESYLGDRCGIYSQDRKLKNEHFNDNLENLRGKVLLVRLKWSAADFSRKIDEQIKPLIVFAESWYKVVSVPVIWVIGIEYKAGRGPAFLRSLPGIKSSNERHLRKWLGRYNAEYNNRMMITLDELGDITFEDIESWSKYVTHKLKLDLDQRHIVEKNLCAEFSLDQKWDMSTLIDGKLKEFVKSIQTIKGMPNEAAI